MLLHSAPPQCSSSSPPSLSPTMSPSMSTASKLAHRSRHNSSPSHTNTTPLTSSPRRIGTTTDNKTPLLQALKLVVLKKNLNALMLLSPLSIIPFYTLKANSPETLSQASPLLFLLALVSLVPFADSLSFVTEQLSYHTNPQASGLINATFGNASVSPQTQPNLFHHSNFSPLLPFPRSLLLKLTGAYLLLLRPLR